MYVCFNRHLGEAYEAHCNAAVDVDRTQLLAQGLDRLYDLNATKGEACSLNVAHQGPTATNLEHT